MPKIASYRYEDDVQKMVKKEKVKLFEKSGRKLIYMPSSGWGYTMAA